MKCHRVQPVPQVGVQVCCVRKSCPEGKGTTGPGAQVKVGKKADGPVSPAGRKDGVRRTVRKGMEKCFGTGAVVRGKRATPGRCRISVDDFQAFFPQEGERVRIAVGVPPKTGRYQCEAVPPFQGASGFQPGDDGESSFQSQSFMMYSTSISRRA